MATAVWALIGIDSGVTLTLLYLLARLNARVERLEERTKHL